MHVLGKLNSYMFGTSSETVENTVEQPLECTIKINLKNTFLSQLLTCLSYMVVVRNLVWMLIKWTTLEMVKFE